MLPNSITRILPIRIGQLLANQIALFEPPSPSENDAYYEVICSDSYHLNNFFRANIVLKLPLD